MKGEHKKLVLGVFIYKILINILRLIVGFTLIYAKGSLQEASRFLFHRPLNFPVQQLWFVYFLAITLIIFSIIEIFLAIMMKSNRKIGAQGLFVMAILWIPIELMFIARFFASHKIISLLVDALIIYLLFRIIKGHKKNKGKSGELLISRLIGI